MKVVATEQPIEELQTESLVIPVFEGDKNFSERVPANLTESDFSGKLYETFLIPPSAETPKILLVGAGKKADFDVRLARNIAGAATRRLLKSKVKRIAFDASIYDKPSLIIEGVGLAEFDPGIYKTGKDRPTKVEELTILGIISSSEIKKSLNIVETTNWVRRLISEPANLLTPKHIVEHARQIAKTSNLGIEVYDEKQAARA